MTHSLERYTTATLATGLLLFIAGYLAAFTIAGAALIVAGASLLALGGSVKLGLHPAIAAIVAIATAAFLTWQVLESLD